MYKPNNIQISTTSTCTLNCEFCAKGAFTIPDFTLPMDTFKSYVDRCIEYGIRNFELSPCIGDPLCDPHIIDRVEYLNSKDIDSVYFYTNLVLATERTFEMLSRFDKFKLYVSVYGDNPDRFLENTNADVFDEFIDNLDLLISNYSIIIDELHMRFAGWDEGKLNKVTSQFYRVLKKGLLSKVIKPEQLINKTIHYNWTGNLSSDSLDKSTPKVNGRKGVCHFALVDNGIYPDGQITMCHWFDVQKKMVIGDVHDLTGTYMEDGTYQHIINEQDAGLYRSMCVNCQGYQGVCEDDPVK